MSRWLLAWEIWGGMDIWVRMVYFATQIRRWLAFSGTSSLEFYVWVYFGRGKSVRVVLEVCDSVEALWEQEWDHSLGGPSDKYSLTFPSRKRLSRSLSIAYPTRPRNLASQIFATTTAIAREITYPQIVILEGRWFGWLNPPPLGKSLLLLSYWAFIAALLTPGAIIGDAYYWERIGFRAAWISVTQVPLVYLLASKISIIGRHSGSSYERLNWLHRWISRTLLVSVTVHGSFFFAE